MSDNHRVPAADSPLAEECPDCFAPVGAYCDPDCPTGVIDPAYTREIEPPSAWEPPPPPGW